MTASGCSIYFICYASVTQWPLIIDGSCDIWSWWRELKNCCIQVKDLDVGAVGHCIFFVWVNGTTACEITSPCVSLFSSDLLSGLCARCWECMWDRKTLAPETETPSCTHATTWRSSTTTSSTFWPPAILWVFDFKNVQDRIMQDFFFTLSPAAAFRGLALWKDCADVCSFFVLVFVLRTGVAPNLYVLISNLL